MMESQHNNGSNRSFQEKDAAAIVKSYPTVPLTVDCVIFGFDENALKVLLIKSDLVQFLGKLTLLGDNVQSNEDLDTAAIRS